MVRRWSEEESRVLHEHINRYIGHSGGLTGIYWERLSQTLQGVRREDDEIFKKVQVVSKIYSLSRRKLSPKYVMEFGLNEDGIEESARGKSRTKRSKKEFPSLQAGIANSSVASGVVDQRSDPFSTSPLGGHTSTLEFPLTATTEPGETPELRAMTERQDSSCVIFKRTKAEQPSTAVRKSKSKRRKYRLSKRAARGEHTHDMLDLGRHTRSAEGTLSPKRSIRYRTAWRNGEQEEGIVASRETPEPAIDTQKHEGTTQWQDMMLQAWQNHLSCQDLGAVTSLEPLDHVEVSATMQDLLYFTEQATEAIKKMFLSASTFANVGNEANRITSVLTGHHLQSDAEDVLNIAQSIHPLSDHTNLMCALMGATIHDWIFDTFRSMLPTPSHDPTRMLLESFLELDCPKLWSGYQNLCQLQILSSYNTERILGEATTLANNLYTLILSISPRADDIEDLPSHENSSRSFTAQAEHYRHFKFNMIEAYRRALELRVSLAKCAEFEYEFLFPKIREKYDPSWMDVRKASNDNCIGADDQLVAVGLLPSIWVRANSHEITGTLVSKAIVLL